MLIDRLLYLVVPSEAHRWAAENRAKVRAYGLALVTAAGTFALDTWAPEDLKTLILGALASGGAVVVGRSTHNVVSPYEMDA